MSIIKSVNIIEVAKLELNKATGHMNIHITQGVHPVDKMKALEGLLRAFNADNDAMIAAEKTKGLVNKPT